MRGKPIDEEETQEVGLGRTLEMNLLSGEHSGQDCNPLKEP